MLNETEPSRTRPKTNTLVPWPIWSRYFNAFVQHSFLVLQFCFHVFVLPSCLVWTLHRSAKYTFQLSSWCTETLLAGWFYHFTVVLVATNSCINPFIYAAKYREFQRGIKRLASYIIKQPNSQVQSLDGSSSCSARQATKVTTHAWEDLVGELLLAGMRVD